MIDPLRPNLLANERAREEFNRINRAREKRNTEELRRRLATQEAIAVVEQRIRSAWWDSAMYGLIGGGVATTAVRHFIAGSIGMGFAVMFGAFTFYAMMFEAIRKFQSGKRDLAALTRSILSR